jgi:hypothetical protein
VRQDHTNYRLNYLQKHVINDSAFCNGQLDNTIDRVSIRGLYTKNKLLIFLKKTLLNNDLCMFVLIFTIHVYIYIYIYDFLN